MLIESATAATTTSDDTRPLAVVIGSGFGGLAAAVRLGARGYRALVLERLEQPGGRAGVFRQDGFTFDAGPTIITLPHLFEELWTLCGRRLADDVTLRALDPFYRLRFDDGSDFACSADIAAMRAEVARLCPADVPGYEAFLRVSERIYGFAFEELGHVPFHRLSTLAKAVPTSIPPPTPCSARASTRNVMLVDRPHSTEASVNTMMAATTKDLRP